MSLDKKYWLAKITKDLKLSAEDLETMLDMADAHPHAIFSRYYKFVFIYVGRIEAYPLDPETDKQRKVELEFQCEYGGSSDDVYRYEVAIDLPVSVRKLSSWTYLTVRARGEETNYEWVKICENSQW